MRQILLNASNLIFLLSAFNAVLAICMAHGSSPIKEINYRSVQIDLKKAFTIEQGIYFHSSNPAYVVKTNTRVKRSDAGQHIIRRLKSTSVTTRKVNSKRRRKKLFVPVICG